MTYWSVAQTHSFCEQKARRNLIGQGFDCYLPMLQRTRVIRQRKTDIKSALFPRYIFVKIQNAWSSIRSTIGVSELLLDHKSEPVRLRDSVIAELRSRENGSGCIELPVKEQIPLGTKVRVTSGQFVDRVGLYDGMTTRQRERVLLELLGQVVPVELNMGSRVEVVAA